MALFMHVTEAVRGSLHLSLFRLDLPLKYALPVSVHFPHLPTAWVGSRALASPLYAQQMRNVNTRTVRVGPGEPAGERTDRSPCRLRICRVYSGYGDCKGYPALSRLDRPEGGPHHRQTPHREATGSERQACRPSSLGEAEEQRPLNPNP